MMYGGCEVSSHPPFSFHLDPVAPPVAAWPLCSLLAAAVALAQPPADDLAARAQQGKAAMAAGRYDEAAAIYGDIVKALPNEAGMRLNLGLAHAMAGRKRDAVEPLESALKLQPDLLTAALFLGAVRLELGQPARAVAPLEKVVAAQPANADARRMLGDALLALERPEAALRQYRALAEAAPTQPAAWYGLGRSYETLAAAAVERLQRSAADSTWMLLLAGEALVAQGRHANAFRVYRDALEKQPGLAEARAALADIYEKTGHADWAATERAKVAPRAEADCRTHALECDFRAGRHDAVLAGAAGVPAAGRPPETDYWLARSAAELARAAFARLAALPPSPEAALVEAGVLRGQGQHAEAAGKLRQAAQTWPQDGRLTRELARTLYLARDLGAARPLVEELLRADPDSPELALLLGDTLLLQQQAVEAVPLLERAVRGAPDPLPARASLGRAYALAGKPEKAIPHLVAAAASDEDGSLHHQLAQAYQATGQSAAAATALERSQRLREAARARQAQAEAEFQITPP
jgi:tetratricopeptide (TPR) repeat protein